MITHCICYNKSFEYIQKYLKENNIKNLKDLKDICDKCRLCNPYIEKMLETGQTVFTIDKPKT